MAQILRPHHAGIQVADLERSVHFYRDILGFELVFQWNPQAEYIRTITGYADADIHAAILRMPGSDVFLEILEYRDVNKTPIDTRTANPGTAHLAFFTDDCEALTRSSSPRASMRSARRSPRPSAPTRAAARCT